MGIEIPGSVRWVAEKVVGADWPDADETSMQRLATSWSDAAMSLNDIAADGDQATQAALAGITGETADAISTAWEKLGPSGAINEISSLCKELSESLDGAAEDVRNAKLTIIAALIALAAELAAIAAAAVMTLGAASPAGVAAEAATQVTVRMVIRELIISVLRRAAIGAVKGAAISGGIEALKEAALQTYEIHEGERSSYDWGDVAEAGGKGAVKGSVKGAITGAFNLPGALQGGLKHPGVYAAGLIGGEVQSATVGKTRFNDAVKDIALEKTGLDDDVDRAKHSFEDLKDSMS